MLFYFQRDFFLGVFLQFMNRDIYFQADQAIEMPTESTYQHYFSITHGKIGYTSRGCDAVKILYTLHKCNMLISQRSFMNQDFGTLVSIELMSPARSSCGIVHTHLLAFSEPRIHSWGLPATNVVSISHCSLQVAVFESRHNYY
jgi:hypothetical protein